MTKELIGTGTALATPMNKDYSVDWKSLENLINHTINGGANYLVVLGTTGESPVFTWKEMLEILEFAFEKVNNRVPIVFGVGGNDTEVVVKKSKDVKSFDLSAVLSVCPYYNKPSQKGILRHFNMIADASEFPVILYNVPARTVTNIEAETSIELSGHKNIVAIKEAHEDMIQAKSIIDNSSDDFLILSGNDHNALEMIQLGGNGIISVASNLIPKEFCTMIKLGLAGKLDEAINIDNNLKNIYKLLSAEGNPVSLKAGLEAIKICERTVKPPLYNGSDSLLSEFKKVLT